MSDFSDREQRAGARWFFLAGAAALALAVSLWSADEKVSHSLSERELGQTLHQLRSAQSRLPSRSTDERQLYTAKANDSTVEPYTFSAEGHKDTEGDKEGTHEGH